MPTILIVDDDERIKRMLIRRLRKVGYNVETAENGAAGMDKALAVRPDLVFMDMHMPVMDGYTAARKLRAKGYVGLICALTASAMVEETNKSIEAGCDFFLSKPIGIDLEQRVEELMARVRT